jgi:hypothetical protein
MSIQEQHRIYSIEKCENTTQYSIILASRKTVFVKGNEPSHASSSKARASLNRIKSTQNHYKERTVKVDLASQLLAQKSSYSTALILPPSYTRYESKDEVTKTATRHLLFIQTH